MQAMEISKTALDVEWRRLELIAQNLANLGTTHVEGGGPYRALTLSTGPRASFSAQLEGEVENLSGVEIYGVQADNAPARSVFEPANPDADANGFVAYPVIDQTQQMTLMLKTERSYEANIVAMNAARDMYAKAMQLGRRS